MDFMREWTFFQNWKKVKGEDHQQSGREYQDHKDGAGDRQGAAVFHKQVFEGAGQRVIVLFFLRAFENICCQLTADC